MTWARLRPLAVMMVLACALASGTRGRAQGTPAPGASVRVYVLDGGILESDPARYQLTKDEVSESRLSVAAYLIVHPRGILMWDTGAVPDGGWTPTGQPVPTRLVLADGQERRVTIQATLASQLAASGYSPRDVTHLALSHYHWDHTANANLFAAATWLVPQVERDLMFADSVATAQPATYASLRDSKTVIVTGDEHDVFGDGAVVLKRAPGHTPGHQVLYVRLARTGGIVLSGDLYHYPQERTLNRFPTFEFSQAQTRTSRAAVEALLTRTGAQLWIQHDLTAHARLRKAPQFYE